MDRMNRRRSITIVTIIFSLVLLFAGLIFGDLTEAIFIKAVTICTECIGIG